MISADFTSAVLSGSGGGRPACRIGDKDSVHDCIAPTRAEGAQTVFVNGRPWSCQGDKNTVHMINGDEPCTVPHVGQIERGSTTVLVEGMGAGRIGDVVTDCGMVVAEGSDDVYAGG